MKKIISFISLAVLMLVMVGCCKTTTKEEKYTVKFITNTTDTIADQIVTKGEKVTKPADPVKEGYTFYGWYIDDEKWVFSGYTVTSDITLTAFFWKEPVYVTDIDGSNTEGYVKCSPQEAKEKECEGYITIKNYKKGMKIPLDFRPIPGNADEKKLKYEVATNSQKYCEITPNPDGTATLTIKEQQSLTIYIRAQDSQGFYITIKINVDNPDW